MRKFISYSSWFAENEIDDQAFTELTEDDVRMMTDKLGVMKKIHRLIKSVMGDFW